MNEGLWDYCDYIMSYSFAAQDVLRCKWEMNRLSAKVTELLSFKGNNPSHEYEVIEAFLLVQQTLQLSGLAKIGGHSGSSYHAAIGKCLDAIVDELNEVLVVAVRGEALEKTLRSSKKQFLSWQERHASLDFEEIEAFIELEYHLLSCQSRNERREDDETTANGHEIIFSSPMSMAEGGHRVWPERYPSPCKNSSAAMKRLINEKRIGYKKDGLKMFRFDQSRLKK